RPQLSERTASSRKRRGPFFNARGRGAEWATHPFAPSPTLPSPLCLLKSPSDSNYPSNNKRGLVNASLPGVHRLAGISVSSADSHTSRNWFGGGHSCDVRPPVLDFRYSTRPFATQGD